MKYDKTSLSTQMSLSEIHTHLLEAAQRLRAEMTNNECSAIINYSPHISLSMVGKKGFLGVGPRSWRVDIYAIDSGPSRTIELTAVGDQIGAKVKSGFDMYNGLPTSFYELKDSIRKRNEIIRGLQ